MADCSNLVASMCGNRGLDFPSDSCSTVRIEGTSDTTINQGLGIDLTDGVHAYDGDGNEIPFEVEPETIPKCDVGEHLVKYTVVGKGASMRPSLCGDNALAVSDACSDLTTVEKDRIVTITQADPPVISGIEPMEINTNTDFDPTDGVSAVDDNGNVVPFEYSGDYDLMASGEIASFETEKAQNAKSVVVSLSPIQDLHGYDKPWSGGNGKNKLQVTATSGIVNGVTLTVNEDGTVKANGTASNSVWFKLADVTLNGSYIINGSPSGGGSSVYALTVNGAYDYGSGANVTLDGTSKAVYLFINNGQTVSNLVFKPMIRLATETDATFEPYSNICPISGRTEVVTQRTGVNVWDEEWEVGGINNVTGEPTTHTDRIRSKNFCSCLPSTSYYGRKNATISGLSMYIWFYNINKEFISGRSASNVAFTTPSNAYYFKISTYGGGYTTYNNDISINYPSTDTEYHAYDGDTYTTPLGRTVYGGTLDVTTGELTVKYKLRTFSQLAPWSVQNDYFVAGVNPSWSVNINSLCDTYPYGGDLRTNPSDAVYGKANLTGYVCVRDTAFGNDVNAFLQARGDVEICCTMERSTWERYQLTPQEVALLQGQNNVWIENGTVEVVYSRSIPQGEPFRYRVPGNYEITYTAEDECGNTVETTRTIVVQ